MEDYGLRAFRDSGGAIERKRSGVNSWMERLYIAALFPSAQWFVCITRSISPVCFQAFGPGSVFFQIDRLKIFHKRALMI